MTFKDPSAGGDKLPLDDLMNALLLFTVTENVAEIITAYGPSSAVRCDVAVLDGAHKGDEYADTLVFPKMLQSQLRSSIGEQVIGRLYRGTAKPGQSPPWLLSAASDADKTIGEKYLAHVAQRAVEAEEPF